jgi:hypothetical protein
VSRAVQRKIEIAGQVLLLCDACALVQPIAEVTDSFWPPEGHGHCATCDAIEIELQEAYRELGRLRDAETLDKKAVVSATRKCSHLLNSLAGTDESTRVFVPIERNCFDLRHRC